jgi:hypothetical protein
MVYPLVARPQEAQEAAMRLTIPILALIALALSGAVLALFTMDALIGFSDVDLRGYLFLLPALLSVPVALATFLLGLIASAQRRQFGWVIALLLVGLVTIAMPVIANILGQSFVSHPEMIPACQVAASSASQCQASATDLFWQNAPTWAFLAAPLLIGLVALLYTFRMPQATERTP